MRNKNILTESTKSKFKVLEHKPANVLKRIQGVLSDFKSNRNGRIYPRELWENVLNSDYVKEMIESHGLVGELDHPEERLEISLQNVSHVINDMWIEGDQVMGTIDILPTPSGKIVSELIDYGTDIGISSRGAGSVGAGNIVDPDYQFVTFDFVARPSCEAARLNTIVESVQTEIDNNSDDKVKNILEGYKTGLKEDNIDKDNKYFNDEDIIRIKKTFNKSKNLLLDYLNNHENVDLNSIKIEGPYYARHSEIMALTFKLSIIFSNMRYGPFVTSIFIHAHNPYVAEVRSKDVKIDNNIEKSAKTLVDAFIKYDFKDILEDVKHEDSGLAGFNKIKNITKDNKIELNEFIDRNSNLKEDNTTSSYIDIQEIVRYAEEYLTALLNSSVGITKQQDGQYMITMRNDDKTINKWLELHDKYNLNEESDFETYIDYSGERPVEKQRHTMSYCNMAALDMVHDALSDELGPDWRKKSLSDIEDIVHSTVYKYNEANVQPEYEDEEFYGDEASAIEVYQYILDNEIPKENKTTETRINEFDSLRESIVNETIKEILE